MSRIEILVVPDLYTSYRKSVEHLEESSYRDLFLNQPRDLEQHLSAVARNKLTYGDLIHKIMEEELIAEPIDGWRYPVEPLLKSLPRLKAKNKELTIHCCVNPAYYRLRIEKASELARLTLRSNMTGRVEVEEWKTTIMDLVNKKPEELEREVGVIDRRAGERAVCISGYDGKSLEELLSEEGHEVTRIEVEEFYHPKPLERLEGKLEKSRGKTPEEEIKTLVREHLSYVKDFILQNRTRDQAYWKWAFDNFPDVAERFGLEEIEMLRHIALDEISNYP